jgi:branched-chain amino acid transport system permease protein
MEQLLQAVLTGILIGGVYALIAAGLTLVFGVMGIVNFAHGEFVMLGMYGVYMAVKWFGIDPYLTLPLVIVEMIVISAILYRVLIVRVEGKAHNQQILLTLGLSIVLTNGAMMIWGPNYLTIDSPTAIKNLSAYGTSLSVGWLIAFGCAVTITLLLYLLLHRTDLGKMIRAVSQNREAAVLMGIDTRFVYTVAFCISAVVAGMGGALISNIYYIAPSTGSQFILTAFVVVVLGGMGNFWGAFWGGLIIGVSESVASVFIAPSLSPVVGYLIFLAVLWWRPQGLFGTKGRV